MEQMLPFGPWRPDEPQISTRSTRRAENVIRTSTGYRPFPGLATFGADALPAGTVTGVFFGKDPSGNATLFAAIYTDGGGTGWYSYSSSLRNWTRVGVTDITSAERFRTVLYGDTLYITNFDDGLRSYQLGVSTDFNRVTSAAGNIEPKYIAVVRDFLVGAYMNVPGGTGLVPNRVQWSAIGDATDWDIDPTTLADYQEIPDAGECRGIVGGEYGTVLMENGIFRMDFVGSPAVFSFNRIENAQGCLEPNSVVAVGGKVYYLAEDGWKVFDGQSVQPIGAERFDLWFAENSSVSDLDTMTALVDPQEKLIVWGFNAGVSNVDTNDTVLVYNYAIQEPSYARVDHHLLVPFIVPGVTVEGLNTFVISDLTDYQGVWNAGTTYALNDVVAYNNKAWISLQASNTGNTPAETAWWTEDAATASIDDLETSTDSPIYRSGAVNFGAISLNTLYSFSGSPDTAVIDTAEYRLGQAKRAKVTGAQLMAEGTGHTATIQAGVRDTLDTPTNFGDQRSRVNDRYPLYREGLYHRFRTRLSGNWDQAVGLLVEYTPTSGR